MVHDVVFMSVELLRLLNYLNLNMQNRNMDESDKLLCT